MPPNILVFGTGALGSVYTWVLSKAIPASNIYAICRSNYAAASQDGFTINSQLWGDGLRVRPKVSRTMDEATSLLKEAAGQDAMFDYILITAKALPTTPSTAEIIAPAVTRGVDGSTIVLVQNGIGIEPPFAEMYPENPLLSTVAYLPATQTKPGVIQHKEVELLHVGTYPASPADGLRVRHKERAKEFAGLIKKGGASVEVHEDIQTQRWGKLLVNGSWNPICALSRCRDVQFMDSSKEEDEGANFVRDVMLEIAKIAQACGYSGIDEKLVNHQMGRAKVRALPGVQPSMLADVLSSRGLEADAIVGNAVRIAKEKGVDVPMLRTLYFLSKALSRSFELDQS
ncbi:2-dehydropantoate 2-reductase [Xylariaceae sp. FL0016]|nr:2-dehydropantoate 2-reductase [Xylariaceae sp. FL0016]